MKPSHSRAASSMKPSHSVRAASSMEAFASVGSPETTAAMTRESAVIGMARPVVEAVIEVFVVVSFMTLPPIAKAMKVAIKMMVEVAEEENRRKAHRKR